MLDLLIYTQITTIYRKLLSYLLKILTVLFLYIIEG